MFRTRPEARAETVRLTIDGNAVEAPAGASVALAALAAGMTVTRTTPVEGSGRAPYCLMGTCFECLMTIDGRPNRQACMVPVAEGMTVERQQGAPDIGG